LHSAVAAMVLVGAASCTSSHHTPPTHALGAVSGHLVAEHGAGVVSRGRGPVAGTVLIEGPDGKGRSISAAPDGRFNLRLPAGRYSLTASIRDGTCRSAVI